MTKPITKNKLRIIVVSGKSGSGKTSALHMMEDEGFTCIDNLPIDLLPELIRQLEQSSDTDRNVAIGIDVRNVANDLKKLPKMIEFLRQSGKDCEVLFLDTADEVLTKRFSETRRRHPLSSEKVSLAEAIIKEQILLQPVALLADHTLDTSRLSLHELRSAVRHAVVKNPNKSLSVLLHSFGFKFGMPITCDFVFDVRCLPNPFWDQNLRSLSGLDKEVIAFLDEQPDVQTMREDIYQFAKKWLPAFQENNRSYLTIGIGCTGGRHRSVYLCEKISQALIYDYPDVQTRHRQLFTEMAKSK